MPSGEKATARTESLWPSSFFLWAPVAVSQSRTVPSSEADASVVPSGEKATARTGSLWPSSVFLWAPVAVSQSRTVPSYEADASVVPSGEKATALTEPLWPSSVCKQASQPSLIPVTVLRNGSLSSQCCFFILLSFGQNASAALYVCKGACSMIDR